MRNNIKKILGVLGAGALVSASLCGCSSSSIDDNTLVIGLECNYEPFNWTESEENDYTLPISNYADEYADGYDIQFAKRASEELDMDVEVVKLEWDNLIPQLVAGQINCIIAGMTDTEEREQTIDFTDEYYRSEVVLVTSADVAAEYEGQTLGTDDLATLLSGQLLVSQLSTVEDDIIDTFVSDYGAVHMSAVDTFAQAAADVKAGSAFGLTSELPVAESIVSNNDDLGIVYIDQDVLGIDLAELGVSIGITKGDTDLQDKLNSVLANYTDDERTADMTAAVERSGE